MKVHIQQIPPGGLHLEGEEPSSVLELHDENTRPTGPIAYSLDVGLSGGGLFATGTLTIPMELQCVSCLERFPFTLKVADFACQVELTGAETVDLTEYLREDILLTLPPHPHCDWSGERDCPGAFRKESETVNDALSDTRDDGDTRKVWGALDQLKLK